MGHRDMMGDRRRSAQLLAWGIRFFLAAALTASQTPGDYAPFALGCVAACGPGAEGIAALLGAGVGAVLFLEFSGALPFLAAAILIFTTAAAFQGLKLLDGPWFHPLAGAGLFLAVSGIYVLQSLSPLRNLAPCLEVSACASSHLIEAVEYPGYPFFLAVQWHPEHLWKKQPEERALFEAFVKACLP